MSLWVSRFHVIMLYLAMVGPTFLLVQSIEIFHTKNASGVSLTAYIFYFCMNLIWITYGATLAPINMVIILSSAIALVYTALILIGIGMYKHKK